MATTQPVCFLVISDTHDYDFYDGAISKATSPAHPSTTAQGFRKQSIPKVDVVLHCGDLTENGGLANYEKVIRMLGSIDAELKLVIAGNHDLSLDKQFYLRESGGDISEHDAAVKLFNSPRTRNLGIRYLEEGTYNFILQSGAAFTVYASPWTPQYGVSAFQYPSNEDRHNSASPAWATNVSTQQSLVPAFPAIDIMMTHGPPKYILDDTGRGNNAGCEHLRRAVCQAKPRLHCFGHVHRGWGAQKVSWSPLPKTPTVGEEDCLLEQGTPVFVGKNSSRKRGYATVRTEEMEHGRHTLFLNAAVMDDEDTTNAPWMVQLDLPVVKAMQHEGGKEDGDRAIASVERRAPGMGCRIADEDGVSPVELSEMVVDRAAEQRSRTEACGMHGTLDVDRRALYGKVLKRKYIWPMESREDGQWKRRCLE